MANVQVYVLDRNLQLVPEGIAGEICVGGVGLARGYLGRPELTVERFIPDPFARDASGAPDPSARLYRTGDLGRWRADGQLEYLGRLDDQVKIRGIRIEPAEIESALRACPGVRDAAVVAATQPDGSRELVAYFELANGVSLSSEPPELELWPSVAEHFVYDEPLYGAMTSDERRNRAYLHALKQHAPGKVVVDIGTGQDAIPSRLAVEAGARKVYAIELLEATYHKACARIAELGLQDKITILHGDATRIELPEPADVCVSEIVGAIGGSEAAAYILNDARRLLGPGGRMIPERSLTRIAAVSLPDSFMASPTFSEQTSHYVQQIFNQVGHPHDLRLCLRGVTSEHLISDIDVFEDLDFRAEVELEEAHDISLTIHREARLDGLLVWLSLYTAGDESIDILAHRHCWLPVFLPAFGLGVRVAAGSRITARIERTLCRNGRNPDYRITGQLVLPDGSSRPFSYFSEHIGAAFRATPFYERLFAGERIPTQRTAPTGPALRAQLQSLLPDYMLPTLYVPIAELPHTPSGKIDRAQLQRRELTRQRSTVAFEPPSSTLESQLVGIWSEVLGVERIGVNDSFFDLGGHSLRMAQVHAKLRELLQRDVPLLVLFQYPTISALARYLQGDANQDSQKLLRSQERGRRQKEALSLQRQRAQGRVRRDE
jgi:precorrin-6B methylase 2/acyl carrier protein